MNTLRDNINNVTFGLYVGNTHRLSLEVVLTCLAKFAPSVKTMIVNNESEHTEFLQSRFVPFQNLEPKKNKIDVLNWMFKNCQTKYLVLLETDILFLEHLFELEITHDIHAHIVSGKEIAENFPDEKLEILDALGVGLIVLNMEAIRSKGIDSFHSPSDENKFYFIGSWMLEKAKEENLSIQELFAPSDEDIDPCSFYIDQDYFIRYHANHSLDDAEERPLDDQTDQILRYYLSEQAFESFTFRPDSFEPVPIAVPF